MKVVILDQDEKSALALERLLKSRRLDHVCRVVRRADDCPPPSDGVALLLVQNDGDAVPEEAFADMLKETDRFVRPLRVGRLLERVRRYASAGAGGVAGGNGAPVKIGPYMLDAQNNELLRVADNFCIRLTDKESHILVFLAGQKGGFVDRETLLEEVWGYAPSVETHTLETHIYRLRQKIEADPSNPALLMTDEKGYRLAL